MTWIIILLKLQAAIDFRADNDKNFESLEKNSLDLYSSFKSIYLQIEKIKLRIQLNIKDEWGKI